jgi:sulfur-carrier protein adenylyltransferase/sulfurtransferase
MANGQDKILAIVCVGLLILSAGYFYLTTSPEEEMESDIILSASMDYAKDSSKYINATYLHTLITDNDTTNDPYILSIRSTEHYALGHIPGAINIGYKSVFTEENLETLPKDRQIVVYCYTGHTAAQTTALLNTMGYNALCLLWGMCSWTNDSNVAVNKYFTGGSDYPTVSGRDPGSIGATYTGNSFAPQSSVKTIPVKKEPLKPLACGGDTEPSETSETDTTQESSESDEDALREAAYAATQKSPVMKASDLWELLYNDTDTTNDPFILSVRKPEDYASGHIAGAINIALADLFKEENLAKLPKDKEKQIVVVCYTGHSASQATALLNLNGYNAITLMWGMCSWTTDEVITAGKCFNKETAGHDYYVASGIWNEEMREAIYNSLNMGKPATISADSLYERISDNETENDPFILSIRRQEHYALGHIPGAINIGLTSLFSEENLAKLPINNQIVVVCYTGHTASQATALLNSLGFNATALKFGMCSWTSDSEVTVVNCYDPTVDARDYPINQGSEPGSM